MGGVLGSFQDHVARRLTGRLPRRKSDGRQEYTLVEAAKEEAGFELMETVTAKSEYGRAVYCDAADSGPV